MKILLATSKAIPSGGGIASYNQELVRLLGNEHELYLLTDSDEDNVEGYMQTHRTFGHSNSDYDFCGDLIKKINSFGYDCVINSASSFLPVIAPFLNANIVSVSHFVNGILAINAGYNAPYLSGIISLSNYGKEFIANKFNIEDQDKVHVIYNFVKTSQERFDDDKISRQPIRIVYPGGTSIMKSVDVVQRLVYRLLKSNMEFEFVWIGGDRLPSADMSILGLRQTDDLFGKDSRLKITGLIPREESEHIIASANIFLLPSRGEGCPMTLLEAMRAGCISIVSDAHHGSREVIEASKAGIVIHQGSSKKLYEAVKRVISHPEEYSEMYSRSFEYLRNELSPGIWKDQMDSVIGHAVNCKRATVELSKKSFQKSYKGFNRLNKIERYRTVLRSAYYRLKLDVSYVMNKIGFYN